MKTSESGGGKHAIFICTHTLHCCSQVALGNCNFHQETFRACKGLTPQRKDVCP